jgi:hypothetical protein
MGKAPKPPPLPPAPPPPPDPVDQAIRDAAAGETRRQAASSGRRASFMTGLLGDTSTVPTATKKLLGA